MSRNEIEAKVEFPLENLEIKNLDKKYDLYGIINHKRDLENEYYISYYLNYFDFNWYEYDDNVKQIEKDEIEESIISKNAYILFYRKKNNDKIKLEEIYKKYLISNEGKDNKFLNANKKNNKLKIKIKKLLMKKIKIVKIMKKK